MLKQLTPQLLKSGVTTALIELLTPIQADFQASKEWQEVEKRAYPPPPAPEKKKKKQKGLGTKYPGAAAGKSSGGVGAQPDGSVEGKGKEEVTLGKSVEAVMETLRVDGKAD
jgi:tyrosyl-tRNA synthetase